MVKAPLVEFFVQAGVQPGEGRRIGAVDIAGLAFFAEPDADFC